MSDENKLIPFLQQAKMSTSEVLLADLQRKDELIASANLLIDQLKVEIATLKHDNKTAIEALKSIKWLVCSHPQFFNAELEIAFKTFSL